MAVMDVTLIKGVLATVILMNGFLCAISKPTIGLHTSSELDGKSARDIGGGSVPREPQSSDELFGLLEKLLELKHDIKGFPSREGNVDIMIDDKINIDLESVNDKMQSSSKTEDPIRYEFNSAKERNVDAATNEAVLSPVNSKPDLHDTGLDTFDDFKDMFSNAEKASIHYSVDDLTDMLANSNTANSQDSVDDLTDVLANSNKASSLDSDSNFGDATSGVDNARTLHDVGVEPNVRAKRRLCMTEECIRVLMEQLAWREAHGSPDKTGVEWVGGK